jgi:hypothetical protein
VRSKAVYDISIGELLDAGESALHVLVAHRVFLFGLEAVMKTVLDDEEDVLLDGINLVKGLRVEVGADINIETEIVQFHVLVVLLELRETALVQAEEEDIVVSVVEEIALAKILLLFLGTLLDLSN